VQTDTEALLQALPNARWFGAKGRTLERIEVIDEVLVDDGPPQLLLALVVVHIEGEPRQIYQVLVHVHEDGRQTDALEDPDRLTVIRDLMAHGSTFHGSSGDFHFGGPGLDPLAPPGSSCSVLDVEQSNSSLVLDDDVIVKFFRRIEIGPNPDLELNRLLTNEGFEAVPPQVGEILYEGTLHGEEVEIDLGIAQQFIQDGIEGWQQFLVDLQRLYDEADGTSDDDLLEVLSARAASSLDQVEELGHVTAALHVVLSREELETEMLAEPIDSQDLKEWAERARHMLSQIVKEGSDDLAALEDAVQERIDRVRAVDEPGWKVRIHGDYHLGQVMLSPRGWMVLDLEGEPVRSLEERRAKQSPLRDVAGMLRSFSYAVWASLFDRTEADSEEWSRLQRWGLAWEQIARDRFMTAYLRTSHEGTFLPPDRENLAVMLDVFEIDKALYELNYERGHRPQWVRIPLRGIEQVIERDRKR
jgi:maltose alpha-D-glucosyltransferase/alpha-amylase